MIKSSIKATTQYEPSILRNEWTVSEKIFKKNMPINLDLQLFQINGKGKTIHPQLPTHWPGLAKIGLAFEHFSNCYRRSGSYAVLSVKEALTEQKQVIL